MKKLFSIKSLILCIGALLFFTCTATAAGVIDLGAVSHHIADNAQLAMGTTPVMASAFVFTPELMNDLKLKYGQHLKVLTVIVQEEVKDAVGNITTPEESYKFIVKRPDRGLIKMLLPLAQSGDIDSFADKAIKNLIVDGDKDALEDGVVYMGVVSQLQGLIAPAQSFLSNA